MLPEEDSTFAMRAPPVRRAEPEDASEVKTSRGRLTVARTDPDERSECSSRIAPSTVRLPEDASKTTFESPKSPLILALPDDESIVRFIPGGICTVTFPLALTDFQLHPFFRVERMISLSPSSSNTGL